MARARAAGLSDEEIVEVLAHVALNTLTNVVAIVADVGIPAAASASGKAA